MAKSWARASERIKKKQPSGLPKKPSEGFSLVKPYDGKSCRKAAFFVCSASKKKSAPGGLRGGHKVWKQVLDASSDWWLGTRRHRTPVLSFRSWGRNLCHSRLSGWCLELPNGKPDTHLLSGIVYIYSRRFLIFMRRTWTPNPEPSNHYPRFFRRNRKYPWHSHRWMLF